MSLLWPILQHSLRTPDRTAVIDDQRRYTYGQLAAGAMFIAETIDGRSGAAHVGLLLPTSGAFCVGLLGGWLARRVVVPLNYLLTSEELGHVIQDSGIDTILTSSKMIEFLGGPQRLPEGVKLVMMEQVDFTGVPPLRWPPRFSREDLAVLLYTSGTSGRPKGVMLSHGNLHANVDDAITHAGITDADTFLGMLPQFHTFGLTALTLIPLRIGATVVYTARFIPRRIVQLLREHRPDLIMAVPSMYGALLSVKEAAAPDFASLRFAISGGEPLPQAVAETFRERFGVQILEGYGLTETAPVTHWSTPQRHRPHSVGPSLATVAVLVVDERDQPLPPGQDGEILLAGPNVMQGYYRLPEETERAFIRLPHPATGRLTRFFRTGDIGHLDEDGFLFITGRKKEMLIIGGENVFPREIEEVLNRHPAVQDSAVIGKADGMRGEVPVAFVEVKEGAAFDETALRQWCRENLAPYKTPREIRQVDHLPRNPAGKILRRQLKAE